MPNLDKNRPYAEHWSIAGIEYSQDGIRFNSNGEPKGELPQDVQPVSEETAAEPEIKMKRGRFGRMVPA